MKDYRYRAYGITFETPFPCPLEPYYKGSPQVRITYGQVPERLTNPIQEGVLYEVNENEFLFTLKEVATYWVQGGKKITIHPAEEASIKDIRVFLFSSVLGHLLQKRGFLTLHANAVRIHHKGLLIAGMSGAGKSTLTYSLLQKGAEYLVDDIASLFFDQGGTPHVAAGLPRIKLWKDTLKKLNIPSKTLDKVREGLDKYEYQQKPKVKTHSQVNLIIVLNSHNKSEFIIKKLAGSEKFNALKANTYRYQFLAGEEAISRHFTMATSLANKVDIYRIKRPNGSFMLDELVEHVMKIIDES